MVRSCETSGDDLAEGCFYVVKDWKTRGRRDRGKMKWLKEVCPDTEWERRCDHACHRIVQPATFW